MREVKIHTLKTTVIKKMESEKREGIKDWKNPLSGKKEKKSNCKNGFCIKTNIPHNQT